MNMPTAKFRRAPETKFLTVDQDVFDYLSPYALKVYGQLRKLTSYTKENDETEITVKNLALAAGISERKTYDVLNELEHEHFIIQRHNVYHIRYGQINSFDVSQTYGYFKPVQNESTPAPQAPPVDNPVQKFTPPAPCAVPPAQYAEPTAPRADIYNKEQESFQEVSKKKQNTVFFDTESVKNHINLVIVNRGAFVEDEIVDQGVYYAYETNKDKRFNSVNKRINIFLKKVREGKWLIPQGFNDITTQSIREEEENHYIAKQEEYKKDAEAFRNLVVPEAHAKNPNIEIFVKPEDKQPVKISHGAGFKAFGDFVKKLKDEVNGEETHPRAMQA